MKKVLFSLFLFSAMAVGVQAQNAACAKSCAAKPAGATCDSKSATSANAAAAKLASTDATIETKTCPGTNEVCYVRKVSETNGTVSYVDVTYDATTNTFVNVSPMKSTKEAGCSGKNASGAKACCAPGAAKTKTASTAAPTATSTAPSKG